MRRIGLLFSNKFTSVLYRLWRALTVSNVGRYYASSLALEGPLFCAYQLK